MFGKSIGDVSRRRLSPRSGGMSTVRRLGCPKQPILLPEALDIHLSAENIPDVDDAVQIYWQKNCQAKTYFNFISNSDYSDDDDVNNSSSHCGD